MTVIKSLLGIAAMVGLGMFLKDRRSTSGMQKALEANWKDIKKKLPDDWADIAPKKRKEAARYIDAVHRSTGESRRRIRRVLQDLTA